MLDPDLCQKDISSPSILSYHSISLSKIKFCFILNVARKENFFGNTQNEEEVDQKNKEWMVSQKGDRRVSPEHHMFQRN